MEKDIVQALLRAHLHQRQYMDQVQRVLKILAAEGGFQSDHLELLWALTEKACSPSRACSSVYCNLPPPALRRLLTFWAFCAPGLICQ